MAETLILEFDGVTAEDYYAVDDILGCDARSGTGDFPPGLLNHIAASSPTGLVVFEVWSSRQAQEEFMATRLGAALGKANVPEPKRMEWLTLAGRYPEGTRV